MKNVRTLPLLLFALAASPVAQAASDAELMEKFSKLEQRVQQLEETVMAQQRALAEKQHTINHLAENAGGGAWWQSVSVGGLLETEAAWSSTDQENGGSQTSTDIAQATVELAIAAEVSDWVSAEAVLLYEDGETVEDGNTDISVDVATITIADPEASWYVTAGQQYVPFGTYASHMISDSLTLEMGETLENAVLVGGEWENGFRAAAYVFNGGGYFENENEDNDEQRLQDFGVSVGYSGDVNGMAVSADVAYINNILETDGAYRETTLDLNEDGMDENLDNVGEFMRTSDQEGGYVVSLAAEREQLSLMFEYMSADEDIGMCFGDSGAYSCNEPETWMVEAGWSFAWGGKESVFAIGWQESEDFDELPSERLLLSVSSEVVPGIGLGVEFADDQMDDSSEDAQTVTVQIATEF